MIRALRTPDDQRWYRLSLSALIAAAWLVLAVWGASPYAGLLDHAGSSAAAPLARAAAFVVGWTLMVVAMMLPSSLPLVNLFRRFVRQRSDRARLLALLLAGYLGVWAYFGLLALLADGLLHAALDRLPDSQTATYLTAGLLLVAGLYQFTPLRTLCLEKCRSPYLFLVQHWGGRRAALDALRLGLRHGLFCLGCCWTLMLLMFAVGAANLGWMLALGALMAAERSTSLGRHLTRPLGAALTLGGVFVLVGLIPLTGT
jgi:predicted metal-binding membrane protein